MTKRNTLSNKAYEEAQKYLPGGVNSPVRAFKSIGIPPIFINKGKGAYIYDLDKNKYLDFCCSWGAIILGHANNTVVEETTNAIYKGSSFGTCTEQESALAEHIIKAMPAIEKIRFVNSGTEAVMSAIRLARAYTKRKKIIKFNGCYHGHADHLLISAGSGVSELKESSSEGIPDDFIKHTISVPFNKKEAIKEVFQAYKEEIAAIIVEPIPANMGVILPHENFLNFLREITKKHNSLLIFDEVITGFRLCQGGAQELLGVTPDLTCLGKIIGGGFPVGAFGGKKEIMTLLAPEGPVYQAGTLSGNPIAMTAGLATLKQLTPTFYKELNNKSNFFTSELHKLTKEHDISINAIDSMFTIFFNKDKPANYSEAQKCNFKLFADTYSQLLSKEIYFSPSQFESNFISASHTETSLSQTLESIKTILKTLLIEKQ
jgi:glutamate-1-semialdehyde 2,1-aminomutase